MVVGFEYGSRLRARSLRLTSLKGSTSKIVPLLLTATQIVGPQSVSRIKTLANEIKS